MLLISSGDLLVAYWFCLGNLIILLTSLSFDVWLTLVDFKYWKFEEKVVKLPVISKFWKLRDYYAQEVVV